MAHMASSQNNGALAKPGWGPMRNTKTLASMTVWSAEVNLRSFQQRNTIAL